MSAGNMIYMNQESPALGMGNFKEFHIYTNLQISVLGAVLSQPCGKSLGFVSNVVNNCIVFSDLRLDTEPLAVLYFAQVLGAK